MFAVKISASDIKNNSIVQKTVDNFLLFLKNSLSRKVNVIADSNSVEFISGNLNTNNGDIVTELTFKKVIKISSSDLNDKQSLDKYIKEVKNFCEQVIQIEDLEYLPFHYRMKQDDKWAELTGHSIKWWPCSIF